MKRLLIVLGVAMSLAVVSDAMATPGNGKGKAKGRNKEPNVPTTTQTTVPEPASVLASLVALGGAAWALRRRIG
jgi:hypothetical protein